MASGASALPLAGLPEGTVLAGVVGSRAYGLDGPGSDVDVLGCFQAPARDLLGLGAVQALARTIVHRSPDGAFHELGKMTALWLSVNPTVTELLWLDSYLHVTDAGRALLEVREAFLSAPRVRDAYGGYAMGQARRLVDTAAQGRAGFGQVGASRTAKHARHCLRLLRQGRALLTTGELVVDVTGMREEIMAAGELAVADPGAFHDLARREAAALDAAASVLPGEPDRARVEDVLVELRYEQLRSSRD